MRPRATGPRADAQSGPCTALTRHARADVSTWGPFARGRRQQFSARLSAPPPALAALPVELLPHIVSHLRQTTDVRGGKLTRPRWDLATLSALRLTCRAFAEQVVRQVPAYAAVHHMDVLQAGEEAPQLTHARELVLRSRRRRRPAPATFFRLNATLAAADRLRYVDLRGLRLPEDEAASLFAALPAQLEGLQLPRINYFDERDDDVVEGLRQLTRLSLFTRERNGWNHTWPASLRSVALTHQNTLQFPRELLWLHNLESLDFSHGNLRQLPHDIERLQKLETLRLSHNDLTWLPKSLGRMPRLTTLVVDGNALTNLAFLTCPRPQLQHLDVSNNDLTELPKCQKGSVLRRLYLHGNKLEDPWDALAGYANLEVLDLSANKLRRVAGTVLRVPRLRVLLLDHNELSVFRRHLAKWTAAARPRALDRLTL